MRRIPFFLLGSLLLASLTLVGCKRESKISVGQKELKVSSTHKGSMPIKAVCTTGMIADAVRNIGGDFVKVEQLMGEDVDPHLYKVTSADVAKMSNADVIFYSGLHLEGKMTDTFDKLALKRPVFGAADYLDPKTLFAAPLNLEYFHQSLSAAASPLFHRSRAFCLQETFY